MALNPELDALWTVAVKEYLDMDAATRPIDILDQMIRESAEKGLGHRQAENEYFDGRSIRLDGKDMIHFGSCSYLGLELDQRLKEGAIDAVARFGAHFSSSRAYVSAPLYAQLEELLDKIFGGDVVVTPTTTLGHLASLPILCEEEDVLILDHQAHHSLHMAANQVRAQGARIEMLRHNRLDLLEERIHELQKECRRIWYVADGVYSMFGDFAPVDGLRALLDRHEQLHLYLDDAHGVSWSGRHGRGYVLDRLPGHERVVVATTLGKTFGAGGAVLVFPNPEWQRKVRACGGPMVFAGPVPPPVLGSALASARIHLSDELGDLQARLRERIAFCNHLLLERGLPLASTTDVPVRFVGMGLPRAAQHLAARLMNDGFFINLAHFPAVPMKRAGIRFTITLHQSFEDIRALVDALERHVPKALAQEGSSLDDVRRAFGMTPPDRAEQPRAPRPRETRVAAASSLALRLQHEESIAAFEEEEWDRCLGTRGSFDAEGMRFLESAFRGNTLPEDNWKIHHYVVRDERDEPVLSTFFSEALWKEDMLSSEAVSRLVEDRRRESPYFLTSRVLSMGCLLSEGNHLYLDRTRNWPEAMSILLDAVSRHAEASETKTVILRDLPADDPGMDHFLARRGFTKMPLPDSMVLDLTWRTEEEFLQQLSAKSRRHQRHEVLPWVAAYEVEVLTAGGRMPSSQEFAHFQRLYRNVKDRSLALNTFDLPSTLFPKMLESNAWELVLLRLRPEFGGAPDGPAVAVGACFVGAEQYVPMVLGLDYRYVRSHGLYRQCLLQAVRRAQHHGLRRVLFGMGAELEKRRFGATPRQNCLYVQTDDHYAVDALAALAADAATGA
jgi:7-keto-8-aminopelargonate synthetase-like enzyme/predicted N-acyltransferase